jgi:outer membrane protein OmpA-like peptidoglycan-associated protein
MISLSNIQFQADVSVLPESEKRKLREIADILQTISAKKIIVAGHSARAGTAEAQRKISHDRAAAVGTYLGSLEACKNITIMPIGYGAEKPLADNASTDGMAANRRVEIIIVEQSK